MKFEPLRLHGPDDYSVSIQVQPVRHARFSRGDEDYHGWREIAEIEGATVIGSSERDSFELNVMAPRGVTDDDGDRIVLASFEFHSFQLDVAGGVLYFKGYLSAVEAHTQEVHDSIRNLQTVEEFEKVDALTDGRRLKYLPPVYEPAQQFIGWQARVTMVPTVKYIAPTAN